MNIMTLGIALSLFIGSTALEAQGKFRRIYQSEDDLNRGLEKALNYLQTKMTDTHKLNNTEQWDLYLFKKFVKSHLFAQNFTNTPLKREVSYRTYRVSALFMLRSAGAEWDYECNWNILDSVTSEISVLKNIRDIITPEKIEKWVNDSRNPAPSQELKGKEFLAKSHIIKAWGEWTRTKD